MRTLALVGLLAGFCAGRAQAQERGWFVYELPSDEHPGASIAYDGYTGLFRVPPFWEKGLEVRGRGWTPDRPHYQGTTVRVADHLDNTLVVGHRAKHVRFCGITFVGGLRRVAFLGIDHQPRPPAQPLIVEFIDCRFLLGPKGTVWGLHHYQTSIRLLRCVFEMEDSAEHNLYGHGYGGDLDPETPAMEVLIIEECRFKAGGENVKVTGRPWLEARRPPGQAPGKHAASEGVPFVERPLIRIRDTLFDCWNGPRSWRKGAGLVLQGSGAIGVVTGSVFQNTDYLCVGMDSSGGEFYGPDGVVGVGPAQGPWLFQECLFETERVVDGKPAMYLRDTQAVTFVDCGLYGPGRFDSRVMINFAVRNPDVVLREAHKWGMDTTQVMVGAPAGVPQQREPEGEDDD